VPMQQGWFQCGIATLKREITFSSFGPRVLNKALGFYCR